MAKPSLGAPAPSRFFSPASDQSTVSHLKVTVQFATPKKDGSLLLTVFSGNVAFGISIADLPGRPDYKMGDKLLLEYPKGQNPMTAPYSAIYHADQVPQVSPPQPKKVTSMSAITPFNFDSKTIRVVTDENGEPLFVGKDVCEALGYADHTNAMKQHCRGVVKRHPILDSLGRTQEVRVLTEPDVYRLIVKSELPEAQKFEAWFFEEVLPTIRKTGSYSAKQPTTPKKRLPSNRDHVSACVLLLRSAAKDLKLAPSAVLGGYQRIEEQLGVAGLLPHYATDAPTSSTSGSSEVTKTASALLAEFDVGMSAVKFNRLLVEKGILEEVERKSTNGTKTFKSVRNLEYGKNATHPSNPKETQPEWYVSKFNELLNLVLPAKVEVVA